MSVYIIDPSAIELDRTHAAKSVMGHTKALRAAGQEVQWITNEGSHLYIEGIRNYKIFPYTIYDDVRKKRGRIGRILRFPVYRYLVAKSRRMLVDVMLKQDIGVNDHLFVPTTDWLLIQILVSALKDPRLGGRIPKLHLLIMYERADWMTGGYPYNQIIRMLRESDANVYVYTETKRHAQRLAESSGKVVSSYPFPCFLDNSNMEVGKSSPLVCFVGGGRRDKGFQKVPGIIEEFNRRYGSSKTLFRVQEPRPEDGLESELEKIRQYPNVRILDNLIDETVYQNCLRDCSVLVFPYLKSVYYARGSAIVNEAVASEVPFVCTADTSLAEMIQTGNGLIAESEQEFAREIARIIKNYQVYRENACLMAKKYRNQLINSTLVQNIEQSAKTDTGKG